MSCCCPKKRKGPLETKPLLTEYLHSRIEVVKPITEQQIRAAATVAVKLHLRSTQFEFKRLLADTGCRQLKYFYEVYNWTPGVNGDAILAHTRVSKKSKINVSNRKSFATMLKSLNHPNIDVPIDVEVLPDSAAVVVIRKCYKRGSLRDHLYNSMYTDNFRTKYSKRSARPFREELIASVGRQVLEALQYLESNGIPYTHLSCGNIMLTGDGVARLTETENSFLKIERFYEHVFRQFSEAHKAAFLLADINVLAFGCVLYEMSTALPIHTLVDLDNVALGLPEVANIIRKIFHPDTENLVPTVAELLAEPFFADAKIPKAARISADALPALPNWSVTEKEILKDALKANAKLVWPDDEKLFMQTVSNGMSHSPVSSNMGGFVLRTSASPSKQKSKSKSSSARSSIASSSIPASPARTTSPPPSTSTPPPPPPPPPAASSGSSNKSALLDSISGFNTTKLKKAVTVDKSAPVF